MRYYDFDLESGSKKKFKSHFHIPTYNTAPIFPNSNEIIAAVLHENVNHFFSTQTLGQNHNISAYRIVNFST